MIINMILGKYKHLATPIVLYSILRISKKFGHDTYSVWDSSREDKCYMYSNLHSQVKDVIGTMSRLLIMLVILGCLSLR